MAELERLRTALKNFDYALSSLLGDSPFAIEHGMTEDPGTVSTQWLRHWRDVLRAALEARDG